MIVFEPSPRSEFASTVLEPKLILAFKFSARPLLDELDGLKLEWGLLE